MRFRVCGVNKLAGDEAVGDLLCKLIGLRDGALHALCTLGEHKLCAVCLHKLATLNAHGLGHYYDYAIASCRSYGCKTDAGIAAGRLNDNGVGVEKTLGLCVVDHCLCDPVLNGAGRVEVLKLCEYLGFQVVLLFNVGKLKQRSGTNKLIGGSVYFRHDIISLKLNSKMFL